MYRKTVEYLMDYIIERLFSSFSELEQAIESAKERLSQREDRDAHVSRILERLNSYDSILVRQRGLAAELCQRLVEKNWDEVNRLVGLINGLSAMIRDDARAILQTLSNKESSTSDEYEYPVC